jgi:DNA-binding GntR family transcriptional regulator
MRDYEPAANRNSGRLSPPDREYQTYSRQTSGDQAAAYIRRLIFDGELTAGMRLPQDEIAKSLGVSRIPLREAIVALEREGWLNTQLHRGAFINAFDDDTIKDQYELFGLIYGLAARRATARRGLSLAGILLGLAREAEGTGDPDEIYQITMTYHSTVVDAAESPRIPVVLKAMAGFAPGPFFHLLPEAIESEQRGLTAIARAVKRGDGERAAREYTTMLTYQGKLVADLYLRRNGIVRSAS